MAGQDMLTNFRLYLQDGSLPDPLNGTEAGATYFLKKKDAVLNLDPPCIASQITDSFARIDGIATNGSKELVVWKDNVGGKWQIRCELAELNAGNLDKTVVDMSAIDALGKSTTAVGRVIWDSINSEFVFMVSNLTDQKNEIYKVDPSGPSISRTVASGLAFNTNHAGSVYPWISNIGGVPYIFIVPRTGGRNRLWKYNVNTGAGVNITLPGGTSTNFIGRAQQLDGDILTRTYLAGTGDFYVYDPDTNTFGSAITGANVEIARDIMHELTAGVFCSIVRKEVAGVNRPYIQSFDSSGTILDELALWDVNFPLSAQGMGLQKISSTQLLAVAGDSGTSAVGGTHHIVDVDGSGNLTLTTRGDSNYRLGFANSKHMAVNVSGSYFLNWAFRVNYPNQPSRGVDLFDLSTASLSASLTKDKFALLGILTVPLPNLPLHALYSAVYMPGPGNSDGMYPINVLLSNAVGGKYDGDTPDRNVRVVLEQPEEEEGGFFYQIAASIPVTTLSASCILEGPGKMFVLEEIFKSKSNAV